MRGREIRHSACLMAPVTALMVVTVGLLMLIGLVFQLPTFLLGLVMSPLMKRMPWFVEFIYPMGIARWVHVLLMRWGLKSRVGTVPKRGPKGRLSDGVQPTGAHVASTIASALGDGRDDLRGPVPSEESRSSLPPQHSRSAEQRTEVTKGRVYVHPLPHLLDNVGYLIVCLPPEESQADPILGILIDCGDADTILGHVHLIMDAHYLDDYPESSVQIRAVLSTHKHHDHTAGNGPLLRSRDPITTHLSDVYGGAAECVPHCNRPVRNGDLIALPRAGQNDMSLVAEIECVAVPSHTRGSMVYLLRGRQPADRYATMWEMAESVRAVHLFTGDAIFSGGGGVAFEADLEFKADTRLKGKTARSEVKVSAGRNSIERCFTEVLVRSMEGLANEERGVTSRDSGDLRRTPTNSIISSPCSAYTLGPRDADRCHVIMYPGHEYTSELLQRQLHATDEYHGQWSRYPPGVFFETAAHYLVSSHRRTLPKREFIVHPGTYSASCGRRKVSFCFN